jgi:hypothetical protein
LAVGEGDVLDAGPLPLGLGVEVHELVDLEGHLRGYLEPQLPGLGHVNGVVVGPGALGEDVGHLLGLVLGHVLFEEVLHRGLDLLEGLLGHVGQDQGLVVNLLNGLLLQDLEDAGGGVLAQLGVHGA